MGTEKEITIDIIPDIVLNTRDLADLLTNRGVRKGGIVVKTDPNFFHGVDSIWQVEKKITNILFQERVK